MANVAAEIILSNNSDNKGNSDTVKQDEAKDNGALCADSSFFVIRCQSARRCTPQLRPRNSMLANFARCSWLSRSSSNHIKFTATKSSKPHRAATSSSVFASPKSLSFTIPKRRFATNSEKPNARPLNPVDQSEPDFSNYKKTTGLVGLPVLPPKTARMMLIKSCEKVLEEIKRGIPPEAGYRQQIEETYGERLRVANAHLDPRIIEGEVDCGQIEELILQAEDELSLIVEMREGKPWEVPAGYKVPVVVRVSNPQLKDKTGAYDGPHNPFLKPPK